MTFILTNDDGIDAPGIRALHDAVDGMGVIVAPNAHLSGCSHQLTTGRPIVIEQRSETEFAIGGTPADCTRIALTHLHSDAQFVLSGINAGGNMGADIYVSGTVAAVREAALMRTPGVAISQYIRRGHPIDWEVSARWTAKVLNQIFEQSVDRGTFYNVNLPHLDPGAPDPEMVFCSCCTQPLPTDYQIEGNSYRYVGDYQKRPRDPGSDVDVCFSGQISITQLQIGV